MRPEDLQLHLPPRPLAAGIAVAFVASVFAPSVAWIARGERDAHQKGGAEEWRDPSPPPEWSLAALDELPEQTESWFADGFPGRPQLVALHARLLWFGLRQSPASEMVRGRDDWLYFTGERSIEAWRGRDLLAPEEIDAWVERYAAWSDYLAARDARLVVLVAPNKPRIYPEHLPEWAADSTGRTRADQFHEALGERTAIEVVDVRETLRSNKDWGLLYYPLGTHWNDRGAWLAYRDVTEVLRRWYPRLEPPTLDAYREYDHSTVDPDWQADTWAGRLYLRGVLRQEAVRLEYRGPVHWRPVEFWDAANGGHDGYTRHSDASLPRILLVRDSFGEWLWPYFVHRASRLRLESVERFPTALVDTERPDVVVKQRAERFLMLPIPAWTPGDGEPGRSRRWLAAGGEESLLEEPVVLGAEPLRVPTTERGAVVARVEVEPGVASTLVLERGGTAIAVELADGRRWAFVELPAGDAVVVRAADGVGRRVLGFHARVAR